jgi:hypothetical protein
VENDPGLADFPWGKEAFRVMRDTGIEPLAHGSIGRDQKISANRRRAALDEADAELRRLIREGFEQGIGEKQLAEAAGLSVARVYQIRDGRR